MIHKENPLVTAVRELAEGYPDTVYNVASLDGCRYTIGKCGPGVGCIVGQAIAECYPDKVEAMAQQDKDGPLGVDSLLFDLGINRSENDARWLCCVQSKQDNGYPWAEAIKIADTPQTETERS